jgi:hypothetical protein
VRLVAWRAIGLIPCILLGLSGLHAWADPPPGTPAPAPARTTTTASITTTTTSTWTCHTQTPTEEDYARGTHQVEAVTYLRDNSGGRYGVTGLHGRFVTVAIGPDGELIGPLHGIPEDKDIVVVLYHRPNAPRYRVSVSGCGTLPARVREDISQQTSPDNKNTQIQPTPEQNLEHRIQAAGLQSSSISLDRVQAVASAADVGVEDSLVANANISLQQQEIARAIIRSYAIEKCQQNSNCLLADAWLFGRCGADSSVSVIVDVPTQSEYCQAASSTIQLRTEPVYSFNIAIGATYRFGRTTQIGVMAGSDGQGLSAYERQVFPMPNVAVIGMWYPAGFSPRAGWGDLGMGRWEIFTRHVFLGTAIQTESWLASVNLLVGLEPAAGFDFFIGWQPFRLDQRLSGGLQNGEPYRGDPKSIPHDDVPVFNGWEGFFVGVALNADLARRLLGSGGNH